MKLQLDVTNKQITIEEGTTIEQFFKALNIIIENRDAVNSYKIMVGTVPSTKIHKIKIPANYFYDVIRDYAWLERKPIDNIKTDKNKVKGDTREPVYLKDGIYNIELEF